MTFIHDKFGQLIDTLAFFPLNSWTDGLRDIPSYGDVILNFCDVPGLPDNVGRKTFLIWKKRITN